MWEPVAEDLAATHQVICVDQRGHGRSDKPDSGYRASDFTDDVVMLLDALGITSAVIAGHSLGARNAWVFAARYPERTDGVVCIDYTPWVSGHALDQLAQRVAGGDQVFPDAESIRAYLANRYPRLPEDAVERRARWGYTQNAAGGWVPLASPQALTQLVDGFREPWEAEFRAIACPATHLRGVDSAFVGDDSWAYAQQVRPRDRWVEGPADHYVPEERPELVADAIRRLTQSI